MNLAQRISSIVFPKLFYSTRKECCVSGSRPQHLICFKQWTGDMVMTVIHSAINLKRAVQADTNLKRLDILQDCKIMIIQEVNEPMLVTAVSKATTLLGAHPVSVVDDMLWTQDYNGKVFSSMVDAIFVCTKTHMCVKRFSDTATVPVMCMKSRTHASIQAMATVMAIVEVFDSMRELNVAYLGPPHQVLNSYLLLCPMLGANIKFKCFGNKCPVSPLLFKMSEKMCEKSHTTMQDCPKREELLKSASVLISGPTAATKEDIECFKISLKDVQDACQPVLYFHTLPKGDEVKDNLFFSPMSKTFVACENLQYISAALMCYCIKDYRF